jgi:hypothetical protein
MYNELRFLEDYLSKTNLPEWFVDLEQSQIIYLCNRYKTGQKAYFRRQLNLPFQPNKEYYESVDTLKIDNPKAILSHWYFYFLKGVLVYDDLDASKVTADEWMDFTTNKALSEANEKLTGEIRDIFEYDFLNNYLEWTKELSNYDELFEKHKDDFSNQHYLNDLIETRSLLNDSIVLSRNDVYHNIPKN